MINFGIINASHTKVSLVIFVNPLLGSNNHITIFVITRESGIVGLKVLITPLGIIFVPLVELFRNKIFENECTMYSPAKMFINCTQTQLRDETKNGKN